jgi:hypothetical protein
VNTHQRWAAKMMRPESNLATWGKAIAGDAAERERRRIRRALKPLLARLRRVSASALDETDSIFWHNSAEQLDAATRAPRGRK